MNIFDYWESKWKIIKKKPWKQIHVTIKHIFYSRRLNEFMDSTRIPNYKIVENQNDAS